MSIFRSFRADLLGVALGVLLTQGAAAATVKGPIAETPRSQIYGPIALYGSAEAKELEQLGYVQEEYFLSDVANVYGYDRGGNLIVEQKGVPYTTRVFVLRPRDPRQFSGTVQYGGAHPLLGRSPWSRIGPYVLRHHDAFVYVNIGSDALQRENSAKGGPPTASPLILKWFDPERYAPFSWPEEDGIRWDVFAKTAAWVRSPQSPLKGLKITRMYASGWSYMGSFLRTFVNEGFHDRARLPGGKPLIDGYLIGISASPYSGGFLSINAHSEARAVTDVRRITRPVDVPVIELMSEGEALTNIGPQAPESVDRVGGHRLYEVGGVGHGDEGGVQIADPITKQLAAHGHPSAVPRADCPFAPSDVPMRDLAMAAMANIERWSRDNVPPPSAGRLTAENGGTIRDENGNARGGVRTAQLDVPLARYGAGSDKACPPASLGQRRMPLDKAALAKLYPGGAPEYLAKFKARLDALVRERWLLPEDAKGELDRTTKLAEAAFAGE